MTPHDAWARAVFYSLSCFCLAAAIISFVQLSIWCPVFALLSWACFEIAE